LISFLTAYPGTLFLATQLSGITSRPANCVLPEARERVFGRYDEHWDSRIFPYRFGDKVAEPTINNFLSVIDIIVANTN
jgi:hypothetical protein